MKSSKVKQTYGVSTSIVSILSNKCSFCKTSPINIQIFSNFKRNFPSLEIKTNSSFKIATFKLRKIDRTYKAYNSYKVKNISNDDVLEFTDVFSCKCGRYYLICNHTEGLQKNNSINKARRSKKSFPKKMNVSSFF